ncbi:MAG: MIP/aquaporin family protein [Vicinamibacterales bacterium]
MSVSHWREYAAEAAAIGAFMVSAGVFAVVLQHPGSPIRQAIDDPFVRRLLMGAAMGLTAAAIIYSPLGARSGAHMNPSVTLAFLSLGRIRPRDAAAYIAAQFAGALAGTVLAWRLLGAAFADPPVLFVQTLPGAGGIWPAVAGELAISFLTLSILLAVSARPSTMRATGLVAALVVMLNITFEDPLSGMSMNPARSLGPAILSGNFMAIWIYLVVPPVAMQAAAALHRRLGTPGCAKFNHSARVRCIFCQA